MIITKFKSAQFATYGINFAFSSSDYTISISFFNWALPARFEFDPLNWRTCVQFFCIHFDTLHFQACDVNDDNPITTNDYDNEDSDEVEL